MNRKLTAVLTALAGGALAATLAACGGDGGEALSAPPAASSAPTPAASTPAAKAKAPALSDLAERSVKALRDLGAKVTSPVRGDTKLSGANAAYDIQVNGNDAGVLVFSKGNDALDDWLKASDSLGGICVTWQSNGAAVVVSLNSSEGANDSAKLAPRLATALGGTAHGV